MNYGLFLERMVWSLKQCWELIQYFHISAFSKRFWRVGHVWGGVGFVPKARDCWGGLGACSPRKFWNLPFLKGDIHRANSASETVGTDILGIIWDMTYTSVASSTMSPNREYGGLFEASLASKFDQAPGKSLLLNLQTSPGSAWVGLLPESLLQIWPTAEMLCLLYAPLRGSMQLQNTFPAHILIPPFVQLYPCGSWTSTATSPSWYLLYVAQSCDELSMHRTSFSNSVSDWIRFHPCFEPFSQQMRQCMPSPTMQSHTRQSKDGRKTSNHIQHQWMAAQQVDPCWWRGQVNHVQLWMATQQVGWFWRMGHANQIHHQWMATHQVGPCWLRKMEILKFKLFYCKSCVLVYRISLSSRHMYNHKWLSLWPLKTEF